MGQSDRSGGIAGITPDNIAVLSGANVSSSQVPLTTPAPMISSGAENVFEGRDRATGAQKWAATRADLVFDPGSQLLSITEVYACDGAQTMCVHDCIAAWTKEMNLDHFDLS